MKLRDGAVQDRLRLGKLSFPDERLKLLANRLHYRSWIAAMTSHLVDRLLKFSHPGLERGGLTGSFPFVRQMRSGKPFLDDWDHIGALDRVG